jgi:hypothetical protein
VGLSDDQKAMLRLLAQREEGYDDMAALMGISVEEVRERVKEALSEVDRAEADPAAAVEGPAPVTEATPPVPPAAPEPRAEPAPPSPVESPSDSQSAAGIPTPKRSPQRSPQIPSLKLPKDRGALIGLGAGALVILALVIVLIVSGDGGGDSSSESTSAAQGSVAEGISATAKDKSLTQAVLSAEDGSEATGQAIFGRFKKKVVLQVTGEGLEPSADGESYAVWLSHGAKAMVPVGTAKVDDSGQLAARFEVPPAVLVLVARAAFDRVDVTRTNDSRLSAAIAQARKSENESTYTGTPVMSGEITGPLVGAGK